MNLVINLAIILIIVNLLAYFGKKIKIPVVVSLIISGLLINLPILKQHIIYTNQDIILFLGDIGFVTLMFLAGFGISWELLYKEKKQSMIIGIFGFLIPLIFGYIIFSLFGFTPIVSLLLGLCISITAEATKAKVLLDLKKIKTKIGATLMGAGIIDDILGLLLLSLILSLIIKAPLQEISLTIIAIIAFFIGVYISHKIKKQGKAIKITEKILSSFIVPFFFISIGFHFDFNLLMINPLIIVLITTVAIIGKLSSVFIAKPLTKFNSKQLFLMGWAMNSRGAVEFAIALIIFRLNLITVEIYSAIIIMALITTLIFPFVITYIIKKNPKIMDMQNG